MNLFIGLDCGYLLCVTKTVRYNNYFIFLLFIIITNTIHTETISTCAQCKIKDSANGELIIEWNSSCPTLVVVRGNSLFLSSNP